MKAVSSPLFNASLHRLELFLRIATTVLSIPERFPFSGSNDLDRNKFDA
eukprot:CAMPEP_0117020734 /NCGR_PEP_ID=MMETSP0472-20121206/15730_1 /TAXON_ID=693140 ORGANISM="Tiarina fusus, Strain LIS" /NCGR_SAMPLE_ID=MMETSP0472 /ASSEMBLY_ACC=CAM_ASM_000603 /LENGTH=48 /DNA_ID= /DNA_START= /DNA_END= /DNA_ORIENTATION=